LERAVSNNDSATLTVRPRPLEQAAFASFGTVVEHRSEGVRHYVPEAFELSPSAKNAQPALWLSRPAKVSTFPVLLSKLERHPHSAQTFIPLSPLRYLVVVCRSKADGSPDLETMEAFLASGGQGVTYARNVWHHCLTVFDPGAEFAVIMNVANQGDDDVFLDVERHVVIGAPQAWSSSS
jgi:ureidoglycolate lyase